MVDRIPTAQLRMQSSPFYKPSTPKGDRSSNEPAQLKTPKTFSSVQEYNKFLAAQEQRRKDVARAGGKGIAITSKSGRVTGVKGLTSEQRGELQAREAGRNVASRVKEYTFDFGNIREDKRTDQERLSRIAATRAVRPELSKEIKTYVAQQRYGKVQPDELLDIFRPGLSEARTKTERDKYLAAIKLRGSENLRLDVKPPKYTTNSTRIPFTNKRIRNQDVKDLLSAPREYAGDLVGGIVKINNAMKNSGNDTLVVLSQSDRLRRIVKDMRKYDKLNKQNKLTPSQEKLLRKRIMDARKVFNSVSTSKVKKNFLNRKSLAKDPQVQTVLITLGLSTVGAVAKAAGVVPKAIFNNVLRAGGVAMSAVQAKEFAKNPNAKEASKLIFYTVPTLLSLKGGIRDMKTLKNAFKFRVTRKDLILQKKYFGRVYSNRNPNAATLKRVFAKVPNSDKKALQLSLIKTIYKGTKGQGKKLLLTRKLKGIQVEKSVTAKATRGGDVFVEKVKQKALIKEDLAVAKNLPKINKKLVMSGTSLNKLTKGEYQVKLKSKGYYEVTFNKKGGIKKITPIKEGKAYDARKLKKLINQQERVLDYKAKNKNIRELFADIKKLAKTIRTKTKAITESGIKNLKQQLADKVDSLKKLQKSVKNIKKDDFKILSKSLKDKLYLKEPLIKKQINVLRVSKAKLNRVKPKLKVRKKFKTAPMSKKRASELAKKVEKRLAERIDGDEVLRQQKAEARRLKLESKEKLQKLQSRIKYDSLVKRLKNQDKPSRIKTQEKRLLKQKRKSFGKSEKYFDRLDRIIEENRIKKISRKPEFIAEMNRLKSELRGADGKIKSQLKELKQIDSLEKTYINKVKRNIAIEELARLRAVRDQFSKDMFKWMNDNKSLLSKKEYLRLVKKGVVKEDYLDILNRIRKNKKDYFKKAYENQIREQRAAQKSNDVAKRLDDAFKESNKDVKKIDKGKGGTKVEQATSDGQVLEVVEKPPVSKPKTTSKQRSKQLPTILSENILKDAKSKSVLLLKNKISQDIKARMKSIVNTKQGVKLTVSQDQKSITLQKGKLKSKIKTKSGLTSKQLSDIAVKSLLGFMSKTKLATGQLSKQDYEKITEEVIELPPTVPVSQIIDTLPPMPIKLRNELIELIKKSRQERKGGLRLAYTPTLAGLDVKAGRTTGKFTGFEVRGNIIKPVKVRKYKKKNLVNKRFVRKHHRRKPRR